MTSWSGFSRQDLRAIFANMTLYVRLSCNQVWQFINIQFVKNPSRWWLTRASFCTNLDWLDICKQHPWWVNILNVLHVCSGMGLQHHVLRLIQFQVDLALLWQTGVAFGNKTLQLFLPTCLSMLRPVSYSSDDLPYPVYQEHLCVVTYKWYTLNHPWRVSEVYTPCVHFMFMTLLS